MNRNMLVLTAVTAILLFCGVQRVAADATADVKIIFKDVPDRSTQLAHVTNNGSKVVIVTIHWVNVEKGKKIGEGDKDFEVASGKEVFIGGTKSFDTITMYSIKTAYYK